MPRREFAKNVQRAALTRADKRCEADLPDGTRCPCVLAPGRYRFDHVIPDALGGEPTLANCQVICTDCDRAKYPADRAAIDRTRRVQDRHDGVRDPWRRRFATNRDGRFKRLIGGGTVLRATGERM